MVVGSDYRATLNPETGLYVLEMWGVNPPTKDDYVQAGAIFVPFERKQNTYIGNAFNGNADVFTTMTSSLDNTSHDKPVQRQQKINAKLVDAEWASVLYVIRVTYGNERIRVANILKHRDTNGLYAFNIWGEFVKKIKTRKHVKPKFIQSELGINVDINDIYVDCVQLDAIRNATTEKRNTTHNIVGAPHMRRVNYRYMYKVSSQESIDTTSVLDTEVKNPDYNSGHYIQHDDEISIRTQDDRDKTERTRLDSVDTTKPTYEKPVVTIIRGTKREYNQTFSEVRRSRK